MAASADLTTQLETIGQGGFPSVGPKVGMIQNIVDIPVGYEAASYIKVFALPAGCLVLAAGFEIVVASTTSLTVALAKASTGADYLAQTAADAAVGTNVCGAAALFPLINTAASDVYVVTAAATQALAGQIRVWMIVADCKDMA
jgi:hypothetical protein